MDRFLLAALVISLAGCGRGGSTATDASDYSQIRAMGGLYGMYLGTHKNQAPPNEQAFREFLTTKQDVLEKTGLTIDKMFESPRNGQPLEWVYGRKPPAGPAGMTYIGYEKNAVDGKRLVLATRGMHEEMDEAQFRKLFRNATK